MNLHATQLHESDLAGASPPLSPSTSPMGRFTYASGSRPLQGYTIKRGIGHGGFGEVYYATSDAGKEVALKLIRRNLDVELRGVTQCLNLKHPNLLSLYDVKQDDQEDTWVVMELMADHSLEEVLNSHPDGLPKAEALAWIHGIAAGVAYLHDHGIVHRDLKPGNIFVDEGIVKIGDYGLSKFISCSRRSGQTGSVGTVHYMAPEIANGRYGKEIDIYALGVILYEMLTGHVPFEGESVGEILMKHLTAEPDVARLEEPYRTIVSRALAKDPARRFNSVGELIDLLPPAPTAAALTAAARFAGPNPAVTNPSLAAAGNAAPLVGGGSIPNPAATQQWNPGNVEGATKPTNDDPISKWVRETVQAAASWWHRKNFRPWQKIVILVVGGYLSICVLAESGILSNSGRLHIGNVIVIGAIGWLIYRAVFRQQRSDSTRRTAGPLSSWEQARYESPPRSQPVVQAPLPATPATGPVAQAQPLPQRDPLRESPTRRKWRREVLAYNPGPPRQRLTQLTGSMLLAALVCAVVGLVVMMLRGEMPQPNQYAWLAISATLGSWAVLIPAKLWEGGRGDAALRRFVMLVVGLAFGIAVYGLNSWFMISLPYDSHWIDGPARDFLRKGNFSNADGSPAPLGFLAYFGSLFVLLRWWRQADPRRSTRLSIWHTAVAIFFAWIVGMFWPFPQPWGLMLIATIAVAVQLASPWLTPAERSQLKAQSLGA